MTESSYPFELSAREMELWDSIIRPAKHLDQHCAPMALLFVRSLATYEANPTERDILGEVFALADSLFLTLPPTLTAEVH